MANQRNSENNWTYCDFRRNVATIYLQKYGKSPTRNSACGVPVQIRVPTEVRSAGSADDHCKSTVLNEDADIVINALEKCVPSVILVCM
ncbi:hypothetical protein EVAR_41324_1 [Eumeta japonica]|uniref:Uncharacterized protein n=1 Tax=Eumeta variegata TaxID=151549 RepID=A0A4C1X2T1_EUMVA|nr:hypothetical protein EVAR_41324_1 [Eumeta japonica]